MKTEKEITDNIEKVVQKHLSLEYAQHLNRPLISPNTQKSLIDCLYSGKISTEGQYLFKSEKRIGELCDNSFATCTITGTSALHLALTSLGIGPGDEVITTPVSFIATSNAIAYTGATPYFLDVEEDSLGLDPVKLEDFFSSFLELDKQGSPVNILTGKKVKAVLLVHVFGNPARARRINQICCDFGIDLIEDSAQAFGSKEDGKQVGTSGKIGIFSFNGNKIISSGQGGALVTKDEKIHNEINFLSTNAKSNKLGATTYNKIGFNYRMANINASILDSELDFLQEKIDFRKAYFEELQNCLDNYDIQMLKARRNCLSNYWQLGFRIPGTERKKKIEAALVKKGLAVAGIWPLITDQKPYINSPKSELTVAEKINKEILLLPSTPDLSFKMLPYFRAQMV